MEIIELYDIENKELSTSNAPFYCKTSKGNYYVKFMDVLDEINGMPWYRALINEYIGSEIAKLLGLPIPETAFVRCDHDFNITLDSKPKTITKSLNFGSKAIDGGTVLPLYTIDQLNQIDNKCDLLLIMVFDAILHNVDRDKNNGNTLIKMCNRTHLYIIDHGRIFGAGEVWDQYSLKTDQAGKTIVEPFDNNGIYSLFRESTNLVEQKDVVKDRLKLITKEKLRDIIYSTPKEWGLTSQDSEALLEYLWSRFAKGEEYITLVLNGGQND